MIASIVSIYFVTRYAKFQREQFGKQIPTLTISLLMLIVFPLLAFLLFGVSLSFEYPSLKSLELINSHCDILCVVTSQDKKSGRGLRIHQSEVKKFSIINNILIKQPEDLKNIDFINQIKSMNADLFIVVAFRKIPKEVYSIPKLGTINLHASLLPDYRGAAPINWALINNEKVTGVTTFFINEKIDHGDIISKKEVLIDNDDDYKSLYRKLSIIRSNLLLETIMIVFKGKFQIISIIGFVNFSDMII